MDHQEAALHQEFSSSEELEPVFTGRWEGNAAHVEIHLDDQTRIGELDFAFTFKEGFTVFRGIDQLKGLSALSPCRP